MPSFETDYYEKQQNLSQYFSQNVFQNDCDFQKCISLLSFLCSLSFSCFLYFLFFALEKSLFYRRKAQTRFSEKQLIQLSSGTNKLIRLILKSVCNSSVLCFPKLLIQLCSDTNKLIWLNLKSVHNSSVLYFPKLF